ncbi:MAG: hypothetical protein UW37_C0007G0027 [Candidatus Gottesmanbacteria bacterium GW2011_GWA2_44_17]|uniref:Uncharacterized protein n=1 Tax=Candidatus Gottesmanbacteria bacterium GW2011_GWA2_44_17 TaxID=1618444 RepID=A0A0G1HJS0_9BACT|nr:MAG: hypothetical protein UW37_C0007G0027 [Candidatus Gottesmanbacteria bacterium GW2011_GWA2_44_17]
MPVLFEAPSQAPKKTSKKGRQAVYPFSTPFTAYVMNPKDIRFETQGTDEEVILFLRQHIIVLIPPFILGIIFFFMPFILFPMLVRFLQSPIEIPSGYVVVGTIFWYVATFGYLLTTFLHWHFNIFIVTNHRIIASELPNFVFEKVPRPSEVVHVISDLTENRKKGRNV